MKLKFINEDDSTVLVFVEEVFPDTHGILSRQVDSKKEVTVQLDLKGMMMVTCIPIKSTEKKRTLETEASVAGR